MSRASDLPVIAVDAMGGDHGPEVVVPGAVEALRREGGFALALYGDEAELAPRLASLDVEGLPVRIVPCGQVIRMDEAPAAAIRAKPDSPIVRAIRDQKEGRVAAVVSAGSTGAVVAASLLILGRLPSVDRPAIGTLIPGERSDFLLLDVGANVQAAPDHLRCFAEMGDVFCREMLGIEKPRVALLNIGSEPGKGSELTVSAHRLLAASRLNFVGNLEANHLLQGGADVVVTDGFTGNMVLKLIEGFGGVLVGLVRQAVSGSGPVGGEGGAGAGGASGASGGLASLMKLLEGRFNYESYGGALLLGIDGVCLIGHGRSSSRAIANAVLAAFRQARLAIPRKLQATLASGA